MLVDVEIAGCRDLQIERAVSGEQFEHVIKKADAGPDLVLSLSVETDRQRNLRLGCLAVDYRTAHRTSSITAIAFRVCSTTPVAIRKHPAQPGSVDRSRR